jgi:hypothetical protein
LKNVSSFGITCRGSGAEQGIETFAAALLSDLPPAPAGQEEIVVANRSGSVAAPA